MKLKRQFLALLVLALGCSEKENPYVLYAEPEPDFRVTVDGEMSAVHSSMTVQFLPDGSKHTRLGFAREDNLGVSFTLNDDSHELMTTGKQTVALDDAGYLRIDGVRSTQGSVELQVQSHDKYSVRLSGRALDAEVDLSFEGVVSVGCAVTIEGDGVFRSAETGMLALTVDKELTTEECRSLTILSSP